MPDKEQLLLHTSFRPWPLPPGRWTYYQEWNRALFFHWKIAADDLQPFIPASATLDTFEGECWVSAVAFTMEKIRPRFLPAVPAVSDFHEINIRTYIVRDNKPGVYFLNIEAEKYISTILARKLSGLPYEKASIRRRQEGMRRQYTSVNNNKKFRLHADYSIGGSLAGKTRLDNWLTERYCLYLTRNENLYRYEIHHLPWNLKDVTVSGLITEYKIGNISLHTKPDIIHYSDGVKVVAWDREYCTPFVS